MGVELFLDDGERTVREVLREQCEQGAAQEREIGERVGLARAGAIFAPKHIALPVVADLHSGPVAADERVPWCGASLVVCGTRNRQLVQGPSETATRSWSGLGAAIPVLSFL